MPPNERSPGPARSHDTVRGTLVSLMYVRRWMASWSPSDMSPKATGIVRTPATPAAMREQRWARATAIPNATTIGNSPMPRTRIAAPASASLEWARPMKPTPRRATVGTAATDTATAAKPIARLFGVSVRSTSARSAARSAAGPARASQSYPSSAGRSASTAKTHSVRDAELVPGIRARRAAMTPGIAARRPSGRREPGTASAAPTSNRAMPANSDVPRSTAAVWVRFLATFAQ
jgi:hypothetical protein